MSQNEIFINANAEVNDTIICTLAGHAGHQPQNSEPSHDK
jgi:hypothetical protein